MKNIDRRTVLLGLAMCGASYGAMALRPDKMLTQQLGPVRLQTMIPKSFSGWTLDELSGVTLVNPQTEAVLSKIYSEVLTRTYVRADGTRVMLSIAYGRNQSDDNAVHYPDVCYPAQGFTVSKKVKNVLNLKDKQITVYRLIAKLGPRIEPITYWATVGEHVVQGPMQHKIAQLEYGLSGYIPDGMIFRVSTIGPDQEKEYQNQQQFLAALYPVIPEAVRARFFGA